jgi:hypothetical protein
MNNLALNLAQKISFVLLDSSGVEVTGLGSGYSLSISKNGGAFAAGVGTKEEIGSGWYSYNLTATETDMAGPLAIKVTGTGVDQQNLIYEVTGSAWQSPAGTNILTTEEAAAVLRCEIDDDNMLMLLPQIDAYIKMATGHDWAADDTIRPEAKAAARMLLVMWHENPAMVANGLATLSFGLSAALVQLEVIAMSYLYFFGLNGAGACVLSGANVGDTVSTLVGLVGVSGDQSEDFEDVITVKDQIQQVSTDDLSANWYKAYLVSVEEL